MGKLEIPTAANETRSRRLFIWTTLSFIGLVGLASVYLYTSWISPFIMVENHAALTAASLTSPYGQFPLPNDPFRFIPCASGSILPSLDDLSPEKTWARLFDPNPEHWSWGKSQSNKTVQDHQNPYFGRGIFLCGYIDLPLDYTNKSESRIARLAVTKFQVSGLALIDLVSYNSSAGKKSERTIVIEPGGPGGSMSVSSPPSDFFLNLLQMLQDIKTSLSGNSDPEIAQVVRCTHGALLKK